MKIKVDRTNTEEGELIFTIKISDPRFTVLKPEEEHILSSLDQCQKRIEIVDMNENLKDSVVNLLHKAKTKTFDRVLNQVQCSIQEDLEQKIKAIRQEIYNWMHDHQNNPLKVLMHDLDPQITKYYFDNDITAESNPVPQESEHDDEDEEGWEED